MPTYKVWLTGFLTSPHQPELLHIYGVKVLKIIHEVSSNRESRFKGNRGVRRELTASSSFHPPAVAKPRSLITVKSLV
ncbi:hypothetical protein Bca4012_044443 [Brassica carinata]